jgi:hypothetical protein
MFDSVEDGENAVTDALAGLHFQTPLAQRAAAQKLTTPAPAGSCAICLSPVKSRRPPLSDSGTGSGIETFRVPCCGGSFHRACLERFKSESTTTACPLCRSRLATGLTPAARPQPHTGFVSAGDLRSVMVRRAAAARAAVQRQYARYPAPADANEPVADASPGQAYREVIAAQQRGASFSTPTA